MIDNERLLILFQYFFGECSVLYLLLLLIPFPWPPPFGRSSEIGDHFRDTGVKVPTTIPEEGQPSSNRLIENINRMRAFSSKQPLLKGGEDNRYLKGCGAGNQIST